MIALGIRTRALYSEDDVCGYAYVRRGEKSGFRASWIENEEVQTSTAMHILLLGLGNLRGLRERGTGALNMEVVDMEGAGGVTLLIHSNA